MGLAHPPNRHQQGQAPAPIPSATQLHSTLRCTKGGTTQSPCPHFNIEIVFRSNGRSVVAAAAYQSGNKLYSTYDGTWKSGDHQERIVFKEIILPPNAPRSYVDRQTLWNAVDASEPRDNAQTARRFIITLPKELSIEENIRLIRHYCQSQFIDKGMIADIAVHFDNKDPPNPHAHILCTMRSMDERGQWNEKTKTTYALDENGERIMGRNGKWKRIRVDTVDWNDRKYCEIWRHEWEVQQNTTLEQAGRSERVDMRSFKRQGLEIAPQVHLGPAAFALEKKGINTELGDHNRAVKVINSMFKAIRQKLKALNDWLKELKEIITDREKLERPEDFPLVEVLLAYYDLREKERWDWNYSARNRAGINDLQERSSVFSFMKENGIYTINDFGILLNTTSSRVRELEAAKRTKENRVKDIDAILNADKTIKELGPVIEKYNSTFFKKSKEKYAQEHADEIQRYKKAQRILHKFDLAQPIDRKTLKSESTRLRSEVESLLPRLESVKAELDQQMKIRSHIRKVLPAALAFRNEAGQQRYEDITEEIQNQKELRLLLEQSADRAIRHGGETEPESHHDHQPQQHTHQKQKHYDKGAR